MLFLSKLLIMSILMMSCLSAVADTRQYLTPFPKVAEINGTVEFSGNTYRIDNDGTFSKERLDWLRRELAATAGWREISGSPNIIKVRSIQSDKPEYYELSISPGVVELAATAGGMTPGLGRFLGLLETPLTKVFAESTVLPLARICDWPDYSVRAAKIEMSNLPRDVDRQAWLNELEGLISRLAKLGFNRIAMEVGGRAECEAYPEVNLPGFFTKKELKKLIGTAHDLGLEVFPMINCVGHMRRAPQVFPLTGKRRRTETVEAVAMNLGHPDFYRVFFAYLDELCDTFGKPEYVVIFTDEFETEIPLLEKTLNKSVFEFYPDFLNRVNRYLKARGSKTAIAQDMFVSKGTEKYPFEENNGPAGAEKMLDLLDKDISFVYWNYHTGRYPVLKLLYDKGFHDLWVLPWYKTEAVSCLSQAGLKYNAKFLGTVWWVNPHHQNYPALAEFAWNAKERGTKSPLFFDELCDLYFYGRRTRIPAENSVFAYPENGQKQTITRVNDIYGIPVDFSNAQMVPPAAVAVPQPWDFTGIALPRLLIAVEGSPDFLVPGSKSYLNKAREFGEFIVYTDQYGKSSKTNPYGCEFSTDASGKIVEVSARMRDLINTQPRSDLNIPPGGGVFSKHGSTFADTNDRISRAFNRAALPGKQITLYLAPEQLASSEKPLVVSLPKPRQKATLYLAPVLPLDKTLPFARVEFTGINKTKYRYEIPCRWFLQSGIMLEKPLTRYLAPWAVGTVMVLEFDLKGEPGTLTVTPLKGGLLSGLTVAGATQFD